MLPKYFAVLNAAMYGHRGEAEEMKMQRSRTISSWTEFMQTVKDKWTRATGGFLAALAEEEMKLRREEVLKQIRASRE